MFGIESVKHIEYSFWYYSTSGIEVVKIDYNIFAAMFYILLIFTGKLVQLVEQLND